MTGTATHQQSVAIGNLARVLHDARTLSRVSLETLIDAALALHAVAGGRHDERGEAIADDAIKAAGILLPGDLIASTSERSFARWLAKTGKTLTQVLNFVADENDPDAAARAALRSAIVGRKAFARANTYSTIYSIFARAAKKDIAKALSDDGGLTLDSVRETHGPLFRESSIDKWIADAEEKLTPEYARASLIKQAAQRRISADLATKDDNVIGAIERIFEPQIVELRSEADERRKIAEAKRIAREEAAKLTPAEKRHRELARQMIAKVDASGGMEKAEDDE